MAALQQVGCRCPWSCSLLPGFSPSRLHLFSSSPGRFFGLLFRFFLPGGAGLLLHFPALLLPSALGLHRGTCSGLGSHGGPSVLLFSPSRALGLRALLLTPTGRPGAIIPLAGLAPQVQFAMVRRPVESWRPIQCFVCLRLPEAWEEGTPVRVGSGWVAGPLVRRLSGPQLQVRRGRPLGEFPLPSSSLSWPGPGGAPVTAVLCLVLW